MKLKLHINKIIFFICVISITGLQARKIINPTWQIMIDSSDVIAKIEFLNSGTFEANAKILTVFKGNLDEKEIPISGFSDKDIKVNYVKEGDEYFVFLKKKGDEYNVWSPTSGYLKINKKQIHYNLLQTTNYASQDAFSLKLFEKFIYAAVNKQQDNSKFHQSTLELIESKILYPACAQYILMLQLSGYKTYDNILLEIVFNQEPDTRIALARFLGGVGTAKARENLVTLLANKDLVVAEEAANQLIHYEPELAGDALLRKFNNTSEPSSLLMSNGSISQFKLKLMKSLVHIKYEPAVEFIIPMLKTKNKYLFNLTLDAVSHLNGENYISYLDSHIMDNDSTLFPYIFNHIIKNQLREGEKLILTFINSLDKTDSTYSYLVSNNALGIYRDSSTTKTLLNVFENCMDSSNTTLIHQKWIENYFDYFINSKGSTNKKNIYALAEKLSGIDFNSSISDSIITHQLTKNQNINLNLFLKYLANNGNSNDIVFLQNLNASLDLGAYNKSLILATIKELENRVKSNLE